MYLNNQMPDKIDRFKDNCYTRHWLLLGNKGGIYTLMNVFIHVNIYQLSMQKLNAYIRNCNDLSMFYIDGHAQHLLA